MHSLLAPILAQLVTVGLGDRLEARYVVEENDRYFESSNSTSVGAVVAVQWRRASLSFGYSPSLSIAPLQEAEREVLLYHTAFATADYRWRKTTLSLNSSVGYGERDYQREALSARAPTGVDEPTQTPPGNPPPPPDQPTPPAESGTAPERASQDKVRTGSFSAAVALTHSISRPTTFRSYIGYTAGGGVDDFSRREYPIVRGPNAGLGVGYQLDPRNRFDTTLDGQAALSGLGNTGFSLTLRESWGHSLSRRTQTNVGAGISYARNALPGGPTAHSIYPTGDAGISHSTRLAGGTLGLSASVGTGPVLDFTTATVDPRLTFGGGAGWSYRRFSLSASAGAALSLAQDEEGALNSIGASLGAAYDLGAGFSLDGGVRVAWQTFEGITTITPSTVFFAGLSWGLAVPLTEEGR